MDLNDGQVDAAIRYGLGHYRDVSYERLFDETVTPYVARVFLKNIMV